MFCASLADVFEDREELEPWRYDLYRLIEATPSLDWLLLTKRPENLREMLGWFGPALPENIWLGTSVENMNVIERVGPLAEAPAVVRFLSCEPLLGPIDLGCTCWMSDNTIPGKYGMNFCRNCRKLCLRTHINWVIVGGESGHGARPCEVAWVRSIARQCRDSGIKCFVKQLGAKPVWPTVEGRYQIDVDDFRDGPERDVLRDSKGGDWDEWPEDLRVREFPR